MSDLPDLDTDSIGFIAYYNIVEQGGLDVEFDISEILDSPNVVSNTLYDNGVEGTYSGYNGTTIHFRGKQDGWIVAWFAQNYGSHEDTMLTDAVNGFWDLARNWDTADGTGGLTNNSLERCINDLQSQLTDSAGISYAATDVGLYNYEYPGASTTTITRFADYVSDNSNTTDLGLTRTAGTDVAELWGFGYMAGQAGTNNNFKAEWRVEDTQDVVASISGGSESSSTRWFVKDLFYLNYPMTAGEQLPEQLYVHGGGSGLSAKWAEASLQNMAIWG